jgi:hypothetical protein
MNSTVRTILIVLAVLAVAALVFTGGMFFAGYRYFFGPNGMMYGGGFPGGYGRGMMGSYAGGMMGGRGMMGGPGYGTQNQATPISLESARKAVESYLTTLGNDDLAIKDVMIFSNGGYAAIVEKSTGMGAFELLVDPLNLSVYPEHGPNMMWNLKYGMMNGQNGYARGMMGGMMGGWYGSNQQPPQTAADMPVNAEQASQKAQAYLDANLPGVKVSDEVTPFYGYYTIDLEKDGKPVGMLSVNAYTGQVWLHTWHGTFVEQSD